jgi:hypothetical protein
MVGCSNLALCFEHGVGVARDRTRGCRAVPEGVRRRRRQLVRQSEVSDQTGDWHG